MPITERSYYDASQKGRADAQNEVTNNLRQQGLSQELQNNVLRQQAAQQDSQAAQVKDFATQMHAASQYGLQQPPGQTKAFVQQNFPQLVEKYGPDWATATDDQVRQQLQGFQAQFGAQLGQGPAPAPVQFQFKPGPRGSRIQVDPRTGEEKQIVGPDNSQPAPANSAKFRPLSADELKAYGLPAGTTAQIDTQTGKVDLINRPTNASAGRPLPPMIVKGLVENNTGIKKIDAALAALDSYPDAFGAKNYLGDTIRQRSDPNGVDPRAKVADIGSLIIHDRSGAAVSASEFPRLAPFIPQATDEAKTIRTKLQNLKNNLLMMNEETQATYSPDQGYKEFNASPDGASATPPATQPAQGQAPPAAIEHLRAHPELAPQFKAKYGYLPGG